MKRALTLALALAMAAGSVPVALAAESSAGQASSTKAKWEKVTGKIVGIDSAKNMVTVKDEQGADHTYSADPGTIAGLKSGQEVKLSFAPGSTKIHSIHVMTAKKSNKPK